MILSGIKALYKAAGVTVPEGLSRRASSVTTLEQLAALLEDVWPASTSKAVTAKELEEELLNGLLRSVSGGPYLVPEKERKVQEQSEGNRYVGIHVALSYENEKKQAMMNEVIEGGPADRAGVKKNDLIEHVDGADIKGMSLRDVVEKLRGDEGTNVTITVRQPDAHASRTYTIMRGQHPRQTLRGRHKRSTGDWDFRLSNTEPIAYVQISDMVGSTPHELRKVAQRLEREGIKAIVLDLRGLRTSSVHTAILVADYLLERGAIGRIRTSQGETIYQADSDALFRGWPLAVLVDDRTSGASEWLAAALQDNRRGIVVGTPTASARFDPGNAVVTSLLRVGTSEWSISLATGILERGNGSPVSALDRSMPTRIRDTMSKTTGVHPDHLIAENAMSPTPTPNPVNWKPADAVQTSSGQAEKKALELLRQALKNR